MFSTRRAVQADQHFITKSWFRCWVQSPENSLRSKESFEAFSNSTLEKATVAVVNVGDDPDYIAAFMVYSCISAELVCIHCLYVRKNWQMNGIATALLEQLATKGFTKIAFSCHLVDDYLLETTTKRLFKTVINAREKWANDRVEPFKKGERNGR